MIAQNWLNRVFEPIFFRYKGSPFGKKFELKFLVKISTFLVNFLVWSATLDQTLRMPLAERVQQLHHLNLNFFGQNFFLKNA